MATQKSKMKRSIDQDGYQQFKATLKSGKFGPLYIFYGAEKYLLYSSRNLLKKKLISGPALDFNYHKFNTDNFDLNLFRDAVESPPILGDHTFVELHDFSPFSAGVDKSLLAEILSDIPEYCTVLFMFDTAEWKPDKRSKQLWAAISQNAQQFEFSEQSEKVLVDWLQNLFSKANFSISRSTCLYLIQQAGNSMQNLASEAEKLKSYCINGEITNDDIDAVVIPVLSTAIYMITDSISCHNYDATMLILQNLLSQDIEAIRISASIGGQIRQLLTAKILMEHGKSSYDLARIYNLYEKRASKIYDQARSFKKNYLKYAVRLCGEADLSLKNFSGNDHAILEELIIKLSKTAGSA